MLDKLAEVEKRYVELERMMNDPQLLGQQREYSKMAKERSELAEIVSRYREWRKVEQEIQENRQLLEENDEAIRELARQAVTEMELRASRDEFAARYRQALITAASDRAESAAGIRLTEQRLRSAFWEPNSSLPTWSCESR